MWVKLWEVADVVAEFRRKGLLLRRFQKSVTFFLPLPSRGVGNLPWTFVGRLYVFSLL